MNNSGKHKVRHTTMNSGAGRRIRSSAFVFFSTFLMLAACGGAPPAGLPLGSISPNVVVIVIDALRPDHLGCYGYERATSPFIDRLAAEGIVFEEALANSSFTQESISVLLTGLFPSRSGSMGWGTSPSEEAETLGELFARAGYGTIFLSDTPVLRSPLFAQGFDVVEVLGERWDESGKGFALSRRAVDLVQQRRDQPFLMYLHYKDPHGPYEPSDYFYSRFAEARLPKPIRLYSELRLKCHELLTEGFGPNDPRFEDILLRYDAEIASVDSALEELFEGLESAGVLSDSVVVITSDHGEEFLEHRYVEHAWTLYGESLRVPLIFWMQGARAGRVSARVSTVDLLPTLLEFAGISPPAQGLDGHTMFLRRGSLFTFVDHPRRYVSELLIEHRNLLRSIVHGEWKYIAAWKWLPPEERPAALRKRRNRKRASPVDVWGPPVREELYNLSRDPKEQHDLAGEQPELVATFRAQLEDYLRSCERSRTPRVRRPLDDKEREALQALGYVQ